MKLVLFSYVWPEPYSSAAGTRTLSILKALKDAGWKISLISPSASNPAKDLAQGLGYDCFEAQANDSGVQDLLKQIDPDYVIFDRFVLEEQFSFHVKIAIPNAMRIIDTQDLHFLRISRQQALSESKPIAQIVANQFTWNQELVLRELAAIYRSDLSLIISPFEYKLLTNTFQIPEQLLEITKLSVPREDTKPPSFNERANFVFMGNYRHPPNHDGILWFCQKIWPKIRASLSNAEVHLYGAYAPKEISALHDNSSGIIFRGTAEDAQSTFSSYRIALAPLRFGAGIKGKIADSWAVGTPCIATSIGAEGIDNTDVWNHTIADTEEDFAHKCIEIYSDENLWLTTHNKLSDAFRNNFDCSNNASKILGDLLKLKENISSRRERNFVGQILWREQFRSTEFFSRWIELKNKDRAAGPNGKYPTARNGGSQPKP